MSPRVTMQDVARAAGVHQTTVSMAVRNDPRIPEKTRRRIQRIADRLGYRPDPMLAALNYYRAAQHPVKVSTAIAIIMNLRDREELESAKADVTAHQRFFEGARRKAEQIGYHLEVFFVTSPLDCRRLECVLRMRNVPGVILCACWDKRLSFPWDWRAFSVTLIESQPLNLSFHSISTHHLMITREAIRHLLAFRYRRIGLAVGAREEDYLQNPFTIGYYGEMASHGESVCLPHLLLPNGSNTADLASALSQWIDTHEIEVVVTNWPNVPEAIRLTGRRVPQDVVVATLDYNSRQGPNAGMQQNQIVVGERAVEQLSVLLRTNQRGLVDPCNHTFINGCWIDGTDVPPLRQPRERA